MRIFHIVIPEVWNSYSGVDFYKAESLKSEGFIHCSFENQLDAVLERYYKGVRPVLILEIDSDRLISNYVEESSTNNEIYPHIYGAINRDAIIGITEKEN